MAASAGVAATQSAGRGPSERRSEALAGYALIAIPIALFLLLNIGQIFYALYISLFDWGLRGPRDFLGLANYQDLLGDRVFHKAVTNTIYYAVLVVPIQMALGLFLAVIVNQKLRGQTFFRGIRIGWQTQIQHRGTRLAGLELRQSPGSILGQNDFVVLRESPLHLSPNLFVVVNNQQFGFHGVGLGSGRRTRKVVPLPDSLSTCITPR